jgi:NodT family efflux transporter outer membrane factor (OMF) lipoprotein
MLGPDYARPQTPAFGSKEYYSTPAGWTDPNNPEGIGQWWRNFGDSVTAELVETALQSNYDLKAAAARVEESEAMLGEIHGGRFPHVSYSMDRNRAKNAFFILGTPISSYTTVYSQGFSASYIVDFFGKLRRSEQAAYAELLAQRDLQQSLTHSIVAQVIRSRVQIATQQRLLKIARQNITNRRETLEIVKRRYNQGLVSPLDVHLAEENLAQVTAAQPQLKQALMQAQHSLDVLLGRIPGSSEGLADTLSELPQLEAVPLSAPAALLDRRPDIHAAEMQLAASTERVGVSIAAMFPDLTLSGRWGTTSNRFSGLGFTDAAVYSAIISAAAPIFQGGSLKAGVDAAKARTEQAAANYAKVILTAMREVEDALVAEQMLNERIEQLRLRFDSAQKAERLARTRYQQGLEKILIVIDTEQKTRIAENELALAVGSIYEARVNLYLALGGDWQTKKQEPSETVAQDSSDSQNDQEI